VTSYPAAPTPVAAAIAGPPQSAPSIAAGSLRMDPSFAEGLSCPGCAGKRMTRILLALTDGTPVNITSCQSCTYQSWRASDNTLELDGLLPAQRRSP